MPESNASRCLVVDDEPRLRRVLVRLLEGEGFICREAGSGTEALELMQAEPAPLVISDLRMPEMDGVALLREIIARWPDTAVIMVTAVAEVESAVACLQLGALDYVAKPFHLDEVRARVMQALDKRRLKMEVEGYRHELEARVKEQARRIEELSLERLQALVHFLEEKDTYLRGHSVRVTKYSVGIAQRLGMSQEAVDVIALGAELHDIGKIGVSEAVLNKPAKLTDAEYRHIMEHPTIGARILEPLMRDAPIALAIVRHHHERLDGKGFPDGLEVGRDSARGARRDRRRLVRRHDQRAPLPPGYVDREGDRRAPGLEGAPVRSRGGRCAGGRVPDPCVAPGRHGGDPAAAPSSRRGAAPTRRRHHLRRAVR